MNMNRSQWDRIKANPMKVKSYQKREHVKDREHLFYERCTRSSG